MSKTIHQAIIDFQKSMPVIKKTADNPFFKSKYADLADIQQAIQKPLAEAGLGYVQMPTSEGLKTTLFNETGQVIEYIYPARFEGKPQEIGSAVTYAKRYSLVALLGLIIEGEDDDGNTAQNSDKQEYRQDDRPWLSQAQFEAMIDFINAGDIARVQAKMPEYRMKKEFKSALEAAINNQIK